MWVTHGGLLRASAESVEATAVQTVHIPESGTYRVWSKYQSPPYFHFLHRVEILQRGRVVFAHDYGRRDAERMYSFSGQTVYGLPPKKQLWFTWGVDHDAAEGSRRTVRLEQGPAELRLIALQNPEPGGDRCVDFVLLTTNHEDSCLGWERHGQAKSPFMFEALRATPIYMRFRNPANRPARLRLFTHFGHFTWHCGPKRAVVPEAAVRPNQWSPWFNINQIVELVTDEGLQITLVEEDATVKKGEPLQPEGMRVAVQFETGIQGRRSLGQLEVPSGETIHFPVDILWNPERSLEMSRDIARRLIRQARSVSRAGSGAKASGQSAVSPGSASRPWRKAADHKPRHIAFYGSFSRSKADWAVELKDALGYNTLLPAPYEHLQVDGYFQHLRNADQIRKYAESLGADRRNFRVCSFGDEIHLGRINLADPQYIDPFRAWLKSLQLTRADLGADPDQAVPNGNSRLQWYSELFSARQRFEHYRQLTQTARKAFGPQVLTGANFSPHHGVLYYGNPLQWIDAFKHRAMTMFWTEDYIFFVPELPQIMSFLMARARCAVKYHNQPIHMYVMPHAPGQTPENFRRNTLLAVGAGARHIDNFWVAPQENYSENYVSWQYPRTFRAIYESIYDTAAVEQLLIKARSRPARVAVITGKATALNEERTLADVDRDPFLRMCHLTAKPKQTICRKDQQWLYVALRHSQHQVDLITEDDIIEEDILRKYAAVYFAGEWIHDGAIGRLEQWVRDGGVLYASTGLGIRNQFDESDSGMLRLLGLQAAPLTKSLYQARPLLELPLADPVDTIRLDSAALGRLFPNAPGPAADVQIPAIAFRQELLPVSDETEVLGRWKNGEPAVTVRQLGRGKAFAVGTAAGATYLKAGLRPLPWARGGIRNLYNPVDFGDAATLAHLGVRAADVEHEVICSNAYVEAFLLDNPQGTLLTLINWTNQPTIRNLDVTVKLKAKPSTVFSVVSNRRLPAQFDQRKLSFTIDLPEADFVMLKK
jgi:hypothetical protein